MTRVSRSWRRLPGWTLMIVLLGATVGCDESGDKALVLGKPFYSAPGFVLPTLGSGEQSLMESKGSVRVINFWATWCAPCRVEMPSLERLSRQFADSGDVVVLAISVDVDASVVEEYVNDSQYTFTVLLDHERRIADRYGVSVFPTSFVVDKDGLVVDRIAGTTDWYSEDKVALFRLLAQ